MGILNYFKKQEKANQKKLAEITPKFQTELNQLLNKYGVGIELYLIYAPNGILPAIRLKLVEKKEKPPEIKK